MPKADPSGFIKSILQNGVGRYVCQLQRITLRFCKESGASRGLREFIEYDLLDFARKNPGVVVYLQPVFKEQPTVHAEYLNGRKEDLEVSMYPREEVIKWVEYMRTRSGNEIVRLRQNQMTLNPSVQGPWTPFTHSPTDWNIKQFPDPEGMKAIRIEKSATEIVLELAKKQGLQNIVFNGIVAPSKSAISAQDVTEEEEPQTIKAQYPSIESFIPKAQ